MPKARLTWASKPRARETRTPRWPSRECLMIRRVKYRFGDRITLISGARRNATAFSQWHSSSQLSCRLRHGFHGTGSRCDAATGAKRASLRPGTWSPPDGKPHFPPKAKSVIWLFMNGGVSHMESSTPSRCSPSMPARPSPRRRSRTCRTPTKLKLARVVVINDANGQQRNKLYPSQVGFKKCGKSGIEVSDWLPHIGECIDDIAVDPLDVHDRRQPRRPDAVSLRPAHARRRVPDPGRLGPLRPGHAQRQPAPVHLDGQPRILERQGRPLPRPRPRCGAGARRSRATHSITASRKGALQPAEQQIGFDLVGRLNRLRGVEYPDDPALAARIKSYELAFRMQNVACPRCWNSPRKPKRRKSSTASISLPRAISACNCWPRAAWSNAACASSRSSTAPAGPASGMPTAA